MIDTFAQLADSNLVESVRAHARWQQAVECVEQDGVLLIAGVNAFPGAYRNCAIRVDPAVPAAEVLQRAQDFFAARQRGFTVMTRAALDADLQSVLAQAGLHLRSSIPCMIVDEPLAAPRLAPDVTVASFTGIEQVRDSVRVNREAYPALGLAAEEVDLYFAVPENLVSDDVNGFVLYREGEPCSTALTLINGSAAGLYWAGTPARAQRQGLAEACVRLATNAGFSRGAKVVTLQASPFGAPLYQRLGYRTYDELSFYQQLASRVESGAA